MPDQGYSKAFRALGYRLESVRQDWSAANETGVCLSLWSSEMRWIDGVPEMDSRIDADPIEQWNRKPGHRRRIEHLKTAWEQFDRWIDVVIRQGSPRDDRPMSNPWVAQRRDNYRWRLTFFDPETGHFAARAEKFE
jgi:hypothetical protein